MTRIVSRTVTTTTESSCPGPPLQVRTRDPTAAEPLRKSVIPANPSSRHCDSDASIGREPAGPGLPVPPKVPAAHGPARTGTYLLERSVSGAPPPAGRPADHRDPRLTFGSAPTPPPPARRPDDYHSGSESLAVRVIRRPSRSLSESHPPPGYDTAPSLPPPPRPSSPPPPPPPPRLRATRPRRGRAS